MTISLPATVQDFGGYTIAVAPCDRAALGSMVHSSEYTPLSAERKSALSGTFSTASPCQMTMRTSTR